MALKHPLFTGSPRLLEAYERRGRQSVKRSPPDEPDAIRRIQKALRLLMGDREMAHSFPGGPKGEPTGVFTEALLWSIIRFQQRVFPGQIMKHDGRVGRETLDKMQEGLGSGDDTLPQDVLNGLLPLNEAPADLLVFITGFADDGLDAQGHPLGGQAFFNPAEGGPQCAEFGGLKRGNRRTKFLGVFGSLATSTGIARAVQFIRREREKDSKVLLYGYSAGAENLLKVTRELDASNTGKPEADQVRIDLLVTNDAAAKSSTFLIDRKVGDCVARNLNLFQTETGLNPLGSKGGPNSGKCNPQNVDMTPAAAHLANLASKLEGKHISPHGVMQRIAHPGAMAAARDVMGS